MSEAKTQVWERFERGRAYNHSMSRDRYREVDTNVAFFEGNQWINSPGEWAFGMPKPVFNIIKRVGSVFIASLTSSGATIKFEPLAYYDGNNEADPDHDAAAYANASVTNLLEKLKMQYRIREALFAGAKTGDYAAHFYWDADVRPYGGAFGIHRGEIQMELVDGIDVMFGNPADRRVQEQPYILLVGRDTIENLTREAKMFRKHKEQYGTGGKVEDIKDGDIQGDMESFDVTGVDGKIEITSDDNTDRALYIYEYKKVWKEVDAVDPRTGEVVYEDQIDADGNPVYEDGVIDAYGDRVPKRKTVKVWEPHILVSKSTRTCNIYTDIDTGLSKYPIAYGNWEHKENCYHGNSLVTETINTQISINRAESMLMRWLESMACPKYVYNADLIPRWDNRVGQAIAVKGLRPGEGLPQVASVIQPAAISSQVFQVVDSMVAMAKDCMGATDAQLGSAKAENTSALMVLQTNSEVPLENIRANYYEWLEDIGEILLDMMGTYYGERPVIVDKAYDEVVTGPDGAPMLNPMTGMMMTNKVNHKTVEVFDFSTFKHLALNLRIDVGATSYFSEIARTQTLDNLRKDGVLNVIQYLERIPDTLITDKQGLIDELKQQMQEQQTPAQGQGGGFADGGPLNEDLAKSGLPTAAEASYDALPSIAKRTALAQGAMRAQ